MTAQEYLDELERLRKAATPGPWEQRVVPDEIVKGLYHDAVYQDDTFVAQTCWYKADRYECVKNKADANAVYISSACNAVPRLVEMVKLAASLLECPHDDEKCPHDEDNTVSCAHCKAQRLYDLTEPKE